MAVRRPMGSVLRRSAIAILATLSGAATATPPSDAQRQQVLNQLKGILNGSNDLNRDGVVDAGDLYNVAATPTPSPSPTPTPVPTPTPPGAARLLDTSPPAGASGVATTRETILVFNKPLAPTTITSSSIVARFGGLVLSPTLHVSPDGTRVTLFYPEHLPASARIQTTIHGDLITDASGLLIDPDGNGSGGGDFDFEFDTLGVAGYPGTKVTGRVIASEFAVSNGGVQVEKPLEGVTISVDGTDGAIKAVTDAKGNFTIENAPGEPFFVHLDGHTVATAYVDGNPVATSYPEGYYYPAVGERWPSSPGVTTNVGDLHLPLMPPGALKPVSQTQETRIDFAPSILAAHPEYAGAFVRVPADSLYSDDGTRGGMVGIGPVAPDRIPGQLPPTLHFPVVMTVQTGGDDLENPPSNFDIPVPVCFPNLPNPSTGIALPPGATAALFDFNHDTGRFEITGQMTVSEDGKLICTNPGVGIRAPGWHSFDEGCSCSGSNITGPPGPPTPTPTPTPSCEVKITTPRDQKVCAGQSLSFHAAAAPPGGVFTWGGGDQPPSGSGPNFSSTFSNPGDYTVTVTYHPPNTTESCSDAVMVHVGRVRLDNLDTNDLILGRDLTVTYTVEGGGSFDSLKFQVWSSGDGFLKYEAPADTSVGQHTIVWSKGICNQSIFAGAFANPKNNSYYAKFEGVFGGMTCDSNSKGLTTRLVVRARLQDMKFGGNTTRQAGLADALSALKVVFRKDGADVRSFSGPGSLSLTGVDESDKRIQVIDGAVNSLPDGDYLVEFRDLRDAIGNFSDTDGDPANGVQPFSFPLSIK